MRIREWGALGRIRISRCHYIFFQSIFRIPHTGKYFSRRLTHDTIVRIIVFGRAEKFFCGSENDAN
jgi:hypothetical protein